jgi:hypothetical protein
VTLFTVAVFNATGGSNTTSQARFATWFDDLDCDAAIVSEAFRYRRVLKTLGHFRSGTGHGPSDVAVITRKRPIRWRQVQATRFIRREGDKPLLWHDRWITRSVLGPLTDRIVLISSHAPAAIQGHDLRPLTGPGAVEWHQHGQPATEKMLARDMAKNRAVIHGGDLNQRKGGPESPDVMYRRLGMVYSSNGVMWLAYNPRRFELVTHEWLPTPPGSDGHKTGLFVLKRLPR